VPITVVYTCTWTAVYTTVHWTVCSLWAHPAYWLSLPEFRIIDSVHNSYCRDNSEDSRQYCYNKQMIQVKCIYWRNWVPELL